MKKIRKFLIAIPVALALILILIFMFYKGYLWPNSIFASSYSIRGIDVSHYQGDINWEQVAANKEIEFTYIKATEGKDYIDQTFQRNWEKSLKVGLYHGAYHYFTTKSLGSDQADNFIKTVPMENGCLPPVIDIEDAGAKKEVFVKNLNDFIEKIENTYHQKPILYVVYPLYEKYIKGDFEEYSIWIRDIVTPPHMSDKRQWLFWQYSNRGRINGDQRYYDFDVFKGSRKDFKELLSDNKSSINESY